MSVTSENDSKQERTLTNSDLKGLLKAASLTEFHLDASSENSERQFEKSNSLFDLVRSNLSDDTPDTALGDPEVSAVINEIEPADTQEYSSDDLANDKDLELENSASPIDNRTLHNPEDRGESIDVPKLKAKNVAKLSELDTEIENTDKPSSAADPADIFEPESIVKNNQNDPTDHAPILESAEFLEEVQKLQLKFDQQLEDEKQKFLKAREALFGASNFIASQMEDQIADFVLASASDLAGAKIDELPSAFAKKISGVVKKIIGNEDEVTVHLNSEDLASVKISNGFNDLKYQLLDNKALKRGEFEVLSRKSTARVSLFDLSTEG